MQSSILDPRAERSRSREEQVGIGLGVAHGVPRDERDSRIAGDKPSTLSGAWLATAGRDGPRHPSRGQPSQQLACPGQRPHTRCVPAEGLFMALLETLCLTGVERCSGLPQERSGEEAAAHADLAVDAPHRQLDPLCL